MIKMSLRPVTQLALGLVLGTALLTACEKKLDSDVKKQSYAIGQQIGNNLRDQKIDIDLDVIAMSMKDAKDSKPKMTPDEMKAAIQKLQETMNKKQAEAADAAMAEAKKFMEANKTKEGVKTTASGLQYIVVTEGKGKSPGPEDVVKAHYKGVLTNGTQFDSSYDRNQPAEFPLNGVIKGWSEALQLMKVGGKMKLFIPPELGYGPTGRPQIPPNSVLIFDVELLDVSAPPKAGKAPKGHK